MGIDTSVTRIMSRNVISVSPETSVAEIARLLWQHKISGVPVVERDQVIGMVTEYDLIARDSAYDAPRYVIFFDAMLRVPGSGDEQQLRRILAVSARDLMSAPVTIVTDDSTVLDVASIMYQERINAVPVLDRDQRVVGIVTRSDIVRLMALDESEAMKVFDTDTGRDQ